MSTNHYDEKNYAELFSGYTEDYSTKQLIANVEVLSKLGIDDEGDDDAVFEVPFVYCGSHLAAHESGWCTAALDGKRPLRSETLPEARDEARELGLKVL